MTIIDFISSNQSLHHFNKIITNCMSNLANYSPFNRSYQFMHLQNSAYHLKNKIKARPLVKTNLKKNQKKDNPQRSDKILSKSNDKSLKSQRCKSAFLNMSSTQDCSFAIKQPYRIIHKNQIVERAKSARISRDNVKIVHKLVNTGCEIINKSLTDQFYRRQKKYRSLHKRYQENGEPHIIPLGNLKYLNPTLALYQSHNSNSIRRKRSVIVQEWNSSYIQLLN